jgi:hypothetical protein
MLKWKNSYAPVHVSVYDRPMHFKKCIESLRNNIGATETTLFISSDGAKDSKSLEKVKEVREYIKNISGFKRLFVFAPEENTGGRIRREVRKKVHEYSDRYIITEDDNIFSPYFLNFINDGLAIYEHDERIRSISGYMYPGFKINKIEPILLRAYAGWGTGHWLHKDISPEYDQKKLAQSVFSDRNVFKKVNYGNPHLAIMLKMIAQEKLDAGDAIKSTIILMNNCYSVFPSVSLVRNIGHDGTGEHCGVSDRFLSQEVCQTEIAYDGYTNLQCDDANQDWVRKYYGGHSAALMNELIFMEMNTSSEILRRFWHLAYRSVGYLRRVVVH